MEERRRSKRLELDVSLELERLDRDGITTLKYVHVDINDLSRSGIGFNAEQELEIGSFYNTKLEIWTKEVIDTIVKVVRKNKTDKGYNYGGTFVGMTDPDSLKIEIYQMFEEVRRKEKEEAEAKEAEEHEEAAKAEEAEEHEEAVEAESAENE